jgi:hypothetical protein
MINFETYLREQLREECFLTGFKNRERVIARVTKRFNDTLGDIKIMIANEVAGANIDGIPTSHLTRLYMKVDELLKS